MYFFHCVFLTYNIKKELKFEFFTASANKAHSLVKHPDRRNWEPRIRSSRCTHFLDLLLVSQDQRPQAARYKKQVSWSWKCQNHILSEHTPAVKVERLQNLKVNYSWSENVWAVPNLKAFWSVGIQERHCTENGINYKGNVSFWQYICLRNACLGNFINLCQNLTFNKKYHFK